MKVTAIKVCPKRVGEGLQVALDVRAGVGAKLVFDLGGGRTNQCRGRQEHCQQQAGGDRTAAAADSRCTREEKAPHSDETVEKEQTKTYRLKAQGRTAEEDTRSNQGRLKSVAVHFGIDEAKIAEEARVIVVSVNTKDG